MVNSLLHILHIRKLLRKNLTLHNTKWALVFRHTLPTNSISVLNKQIVLENTQPHPMGIDFVDITKSASRYDENHSVLVSVNLACSR
jgi:hypothetical protein